MKENEFIERGVAAGIHHEKCKRLYQLILDTSISVGGINIDSVCEAFLSHFGKKVL